MTDEIMRKAPPIKDLIHNEEFIKKAQDTLGNGTQQFMSSILSLVNSDKLLAECNSYELYNCCLMAAALKLPFNKDLGQAWIVGYKDKHRNFEVVPQLQIGWRGFVQLAQRSGQFKTINCTDVKAGEIKNNDRLTGKIEFEWLQDDAERAKTETIGYVAHFELLNGFEKTLYMTKAELEAHAKKYSQTYKKGGGVWKDNFDAMAKKTVIKLILNRYAPLSVDMQKAIEIDQADANGAYIDNKPIIEVEEAELGESEEDRNGKSVVSTAID